MVSLIWMVKFIVWVLGELKIIVIEVLLVLIFSKVVLLLIRVSFFFLLVGLGIFCGEMVICRLLLVLSLNEF